MPDPNSLNHITQRLIDIETAIQGGPQALGQARNHEARTEETYNRARAIALLEAPQHVGDRKTTAAEREAHVFLATETEREAWRVAHSAYEYAKDMNRSLDREMNSLQTRSANLRAETQLAGKN